MIKALPISNKPKLALIELRYFGTIPKLALLEFRYNTEIDLNFGISVFKNSLKTISVFRYIDIRISIFPTLVCTNKHSKFE